MLPRINLSSRTLWQFWHVNQAVGELAPILCTLNSMRPLAMLLLLGILRAAVAQPDSTPSRRESLFSTGIPDVTITVTKHPMGADMVEMSFTKNGYPPDLVREQIHKLGLELSCDPRGVQVGEEAIDESEPTMRFTKAMFAVDGVIDREHGSVRLNPFARAFAGAPKAWTVHLLDLVFQNEVPTSNTISGWNGKFAVVEGRYQDSTKSRFAGIEYRIQLLSQDSKARFIPEPWDKPVVPTEKPLKPAGTDWTTMAVLIIAAGAVGALVYSLLLRGRPAARI